MTNESELKEDIKQYLKSIGAFWSMVKGGAHSKNGDPDMVVCIRGLFVGIEAKSWDGHQEPIQKMRQKQIERAGGIYILARSVEDVSRVLDKLIKSGD